MANKTYVCVGGVSLKETFDNKYKTILPKKMKAALQKAMDRSAKLTTKPPSDKKAKGFYVDGSVTLKKTANGIEAEIQVVLAHWPDKTIFTAPSKTKATTTVSNPAKIDQDVDAVIEALLDAVAAKVIKVLESRVP